MQNTLARYKQILCHLYFQHLSTSLNVRFTRKLEHYCCIKRWHSIKILENKMISKSLDIYFSESDNILGSSIFFISCSAIEVCYSSVPFPIIARYYTGHYTVRQSSIHQSKIWRKKWFFFKLKFFQYSGKRPVNKHTTCYFFCCSTYPDIPIWSHNRVIILSTHTVILLRCTNQK